MTFKYQLPDDIEETVKLALIEDIGTGDVTASVIPRHSISNATVISRDFAVLCGIAWFDEVFNLLNPNITINWMVGDGDTINPDQVLCEIEGPARAILMGERTALNFLQTLSGTATIARRFADAVKGTSAKILDTRKTIPGLRKAQKYAVKCGGCYNHRMGLYDAIMIKENHIAVAGSIKNAVELARANMSDMPIEVEVENLDQLQEALAAKVDMILLDNMKLPQLRRAVT